MGICLYIATHIYTHKSHQHERKCRRMTWCRHHLSGYTKVYTHASKYAQKPHQCESVNAKCWHLPEHSYAHRHVHTHESDQYERSCRPMADSACLNLFSLSETISPIMMTKGNMVPAKCMNRSSIRMYLDFIFEITNVWRSRVVMKTLMRSYLLTCHEQQCDESFPAQNCLRGYMYVHTCLCVYECVHIHTMWLTS